MFTKIKEFLFGKPVETQAPYKIEAPAEVGKPADERVEAPAPIPQVVEVAAKPVAKPKAPAKKQQFNKKPATPKPATPKTTAPTKPRAPRKPVAK